MKVSEECSHKRVCERGGKVGPFVHGILLYWVSTQII